MQKIEVLGPGCTRCKETFRVVEHVVDQARLDVELVKEESMERIMALGVLSTPGIAIDGRVAMTGRIPMAAEVRRLLGVA